MLYAANRDIERENVMRKQAPLNKWFAAVLGGLFLSSSILVVPRALAAEECADNVPPEGFVALFNGKDLTGWKGLVEDPEKRAEMSPEELETKQKAADEKMRAHWRVADGAFVFDGKGDSLCTAKDYGDFEMYVDWKIKEHGDSGIYLRGTTQIQI
jgi:3-keto-disaccharide hydrolase